MATSSHAAPGVMRRFPGNLGQADGLWSPSRPEIPITGCGPHDYGRSMALGTAPAAPLGLLLGLQIIGVGLDVQLDEGRMHDALLSELAAVLVACRALHRVEDCAQSLIHSASTVLPQGRRAPIAGTGCRRTCISPGPRSRVLPRQARRP